MLIGFNKDDLQVKKKQFKKLKKNTFINKPNQRVVIF